MRLLNPGLNSKDVFFFPDLALMALKNWICFDSVSICVDL